jgi:hypothetical protein
MGAIAVPRKDDLSMRLLVVPIVLIFTACAYASIESDEARGRRQVSAAGGVWVVVPSDGSYGGTQYGGSGRIVAKRVLEAVRERFPLAQQFADGDEGAAARIAADQGVDLIVSPTILHWEDRATAWSGFRDKVRIEVRLLGVEPPELISDVTFESRNNSITLLDRRPEDLLDDDFDEAVSSLF